MFDALSDRLHTALAGLTGHGRISEEDVNVAMREIRLALLEADVNYKVVKDFVKRVRERAVGADVIESVNAGQMVVKIVHEELTAILGEGDRTFRYDGSPAVIAMVGLQGSGKTTSSAKLARWIVRQGRQPLLVAADIYRPAAIDQLKTLGASLDIPVYSAESGTRVVDIATGAVAHAKQTGRDVVILDTAGRLQIDDALMAEIREVHAAVRPTGDVAGGRCHGRPGGRLGRAGLPREHAGDRPRPDQDRRRRTRRRGSLDRGRQRPRGQVHGYRREA